MVQINFAQNEIHFKIVYYGPGFCGKTSNLEAVFHKVHPGKKTQLMSIATEGDRTLYFDFAPIELGLISGMKTKLQLYTVPGQVFYGATRRIVLQGVDGVVFVADSQKDRLEANLESFEDLKQNLIAAKIDFETLPFILQWNKRDLPSALPLETLELQMNPQNRWRTFEAIATQAKGVGETLREITSQVLAKMYDSE